MLGKWSMSFCISSMRNRKILKPYKINGEWVCSIDRTALLTKSNVRHSVQIWPAMSNPNQLCQIAEIYSFMHPIKHTPHKVYLHLCVFYLPSLSTWISHSLRRNVTVRPSIYRQFAFLPSARSARDNLIISSQITFAQPTNPKYTLKLKVYRYPQSIYSLSLLQCLHCVTMTTWRGKPLSLSTLMAESADISSLKSFTSQQLLVLAFAKHVRH